MRLKKLTDFRRDHLVEPRPQVRTLRTCRPSFHEIRSLGAREYRNAGYPEQYIQALMTHAKRRTTTIYLEGGKLTDEHFHPVEAGLSLDALRGS